MTVNSSPGSVGAIATVDTTVGNVIGVDVGGIPFLVGVALPFGVGVRVAIDVAVDVGGGVTPSVGERDGGGVTVGIPTGVDVIVGSGGICAVGDGAAVVGGAIEGIATDGTAVAAVVGEDIPGGCDIVGSTVGVLVTPF